MLRLKLLAGGALALAVVGLGGPGPAQAQAATGAPGAKKGGTAVAHKAKRYGARPAKRVFYSRPARRVG